MLSTEVVINVEISYIKDLLFSAIERAMKSWTTGSPAMMKREEKINLTKFENSKQEYQNLLIVPSE